MVKEKIGDNFSKLHSNCSNMKITCFIFVNIPLVLRIIIIFITNIASLNHFLLLCGAKYEVLGILVFFMNIQIKLYYNFLVIINIQIYRKCHLTGIKQITFVSFCIIMICLAQCFCQNTRWLFLTSFFTSYKMINIDVLFRIYKLNRRWNCYEIEKRFQLIVCLLI